VLAAALLAGCAASLPAPDARLTTACDPGNARAGDDARLAAKRKEAARECEQGRADAWTGFYGALRANRQRAGL
jgi:hypothetical protein